MALLWLGSLCLAGRPIRSNAARMLKIANAPSARRAPLADPDSRRVLFAIAAPSDAGKSETWIVEMYTATAEQSVWSAVQPELSPDGPQRFSKRKRAEY